MGAHANQCANVLFFWRKGLNIDPAQFLFEQAYKVLACDLLTFICRDHAFIRETLGYLFYPVVECGYKSVFGLEGGEQGFL